MRLPWVQRANPCTMSRPFQLDIAESEEYLEKSVRNAKSAKQKERLQMLWWVKSGQVSEHQQLSQRLGLSGDNAVVG
jgi:hypothetical protein